MEKAVDFAGAIKLGTFLLKAADAEHVAQQGQGVVAGNRESF